ncbi:MAG: LysR family transcriptional regulator [Lachnospiraceae bacterium]|nr:LysR family transcriptional regulator [Lachnospiraceae bacterium]
MNLVHFKYIIAIEKYGSISMAARQLYVAQPNLSRAIREVENEYGIKIFERTTKGVAITPEGCRFIEKIKQIQSSIESLKDDFIREKKNEVAFKISVPRATYISDIFARYVASIKDKEDISIHYKENGSIETIQNLVQHDYDLGIIRYAKKYEKFYKSQMKLRGIEYEKLKEFEYLIMMSRDNPLALKEEIYESDLKGQIELVHGDNMLPNGSYIDIDDDMDEQLDYHKRIYIYERGSQFDILRNVRNSFMWTSEVSDDILKKHEVVQRKCLGINYSMRDYLLYSHNRTHECEGFVNFLKENI